MGAAKIWNAMEVAEGANNSLTSKIPSSLLIVDHSLSITHMKPKIVDFIESLKRKVKRVEVGIGGNSFLGVRREVVNLKLLEFSGDFGKILQRELCKDLFNQWSNLDDSHFSVETVSGGITNLLLKVSVREDDDDGKNENMTVRLYGPNTECVINRERELLAIQHLSVAGFGANLLGVFENGIVQSFIDARTLTLSDLRNPKLAAEIAKQLRKFHQVQIPGSKEPQVWNDVLKFFREASTLQFDDGEKKMKYETILFQEVHNEIIELKESTDRLNAPVVFAHNDLLSGNLMLNEDKGKLHFIDFEYGSYNYRGFDIGNHFNEYAGYDCDYTLYPSKDEQFHFFRYYLGSDRPNEVSDKNLEALYVETSSYMLASHLYWALWALIQAKMSPIDFDYISYFFLRYNEYKKQKEECFSLAKSYLSKAELGGRFI